MIDTEGWSARKKLKHSLLRRAFDEGRGPEIILLIQWRTALVNHKAKADEAAVLRAREQAHQPRALRALDMIEEMNGRKVTYTQEAKSKPASSSVKDFFAYLANMPEAERIIHRDPYAAVIAKTPALYADAYDPMEGLRVTTGYDLACKALAAPDFMPKPAPRSVQ